MTDAIKTLAESMPERVRGIEAVYDFMMRVWVQSCHAYRIYPGTSRVKVTSGSLVPHGLYTITRHANANRYGLGTDPRLDLLECGLHKKKRTFPRVPLACCQVLPNWSAAFGNDEWRAAGQTLHLPHFAAMGLGGGGVWPIVADRIQDCYSGADIGWPTFAPFETDLIADILRHLAAAGNYPLAPYPVDPVRHFNSFPKDKY